MSFGTPSTVPVFASKERMKENCILMTAGIYFKAMSGFDG